MEELKPQFIVVKNLFEVMLEIDPFESQVMYDYGRMLQHPVWTGNFDTLALTYFKRCVAADNVHTGGLNKLGIHNLKLAEKMEIRKRLRVLF